MGRLQHVLLEAVMSRATKRIANEQPLLIPGLRSPKDVFRLLRNYLAGQFVGATRDDVLLDEVLKCLFCKLYVETGAAEPVPAGADLFERARHVRAVFAKIRADFPGIYGGDVEVLLDPQAIARVMQECDFSLLGACSDPIGDAFEVFVGSESRGRTGQFFTPRSVTDFLVKAVDPKPGESVIDPACGAGGFLASVGRHLRSEGVSAKELGRLASKHFFAVDKDDYLVKLARLHISLLTGGRPNVTCADSLAMRNGSLKLETVFPEGGFDVLLTNPPFGTRIVAASAEVLRSFQLARKWKKMEGREEWEPTNIFQTQVPPQVLFVERCLELLRDGGRLGMVLPESILSNKSYRYVVEYLRGNARLVAVIGMPEALFKTSGKGGTHTKTCLIVAEKHRDSKPKRSNRIFMAEAKWCGHDSRARTIPKNDIPEICKCLEAFKKQQRLDPSRLGFALDDAKVLANILCPRYYDPQIEEELAALESTHRMVSLGQLVNDGVLSISTGDELGKLAYGTGDIPFVRTSDISNWELKADPKHSVDRSYYDGLRKKQDVQPHDILMVKDGTYLIGTCAIITEYDTEIVYQSHLYKIRVQKNDLGLNPFLLLAILSSPVVQRQVKAKQFTQDIIDSLGGRIDELVLPILKNKRKAAKITGMVRKTIEDRIEARELAREARMAVAS